MSVLAAIDLAIVTSLTWSETPGKRVLWDMLFALVTTRPHPRLVADMVDLLSTTIHIFVCGRGLALYTERAYQVNVNVLVPRAVEDTPCLLEELSAEFCSGRHAESTLNLKPLLSHVPTLTGSVHYRRLVPTRRAARDVRLVGDEVECEGGARTPVVRRVDARGIAAYTPLTQCRFEDAEDTLYWHRFACGTIAVFRNPVQPLVEPVPFPQPISDGVVVVRVLHVSVRQVLDALMPED
jgi:hypothetical protein